MHAPPVSTRRDDPRLLTTIQVRRHRGNGYVRASPCSGEAAVQTRQVLWSGLLYTGRCPRHASTRPSTSTYTSSSPLPAANTNANTNAGAALGMHIWAGRTYGAIGCGVLTAAFVLLAVAVGARHYDCGCMTQQPPSLGRMSCSRVLHHGVRTQRSSTTNSCRMAVTRQCSS